MNRTDWRALALDALWRQNPNLVMLLGLCPLLAVTTSAVNGLGLGLATTLVMALANTLVAALRQRIPEPVRLPVHILLIAGLVTVIDLLMNAWMQPLYRVLGIFVPLIVVNCIVLGRVESFAARNPVLPALADGLLAGLGSTLVLTTLGALRELIGRGTLFSGIDLAFGPGVRDWSLTVFSDYPNFLLAILPPGAFIGMGLLIAGKNALDARRQHRASGFTPRPDGKKNRA